MLFIFYTYALASCQINGRNLLLYLSSDQMKYDNDISETKNKDNKSVFYVNDQIIAQETQVPGKYCFYAIPDYHHCLYLKVFVALGWVPTDKDFGNKSSYFCCSMHAFNFELKSFCSQNACYVANTDYKYFHLDKATTLRFLNQVYYDHEGCNTSPPMIRFVEGNPKGSCTIL